MVSKENIKSLLKECGLFLLQVIFFEIGLFGFSFSVAMPFAFIRLFNGANLVFVAIEYAIGGLIYDFSFSGLVLIGYDIVVLSLYYFSLEFFKIKRKNLLLILFLLVSNALELYFSLFTALEMIELLILFIIEVCALFYFKKLYQVYKKKFIFYKISKFDSLLFSVFLMLLCLGLFGLNGFNTYIVLLISIFTVIFLCKILPTEKSLFISLALLLSLGIVVGEIKYILFGIILILFGINFSILNKFLYLIIMTLALGLCVVLNGEFENIFALVGLVIPLVICLIIPSKIYIKLSRIFEEKTQNIIYDNVQNEKIEEIRRKLLSMSKTFFSMKENFKCLLVGKINRKIAAEELAKDVMSKCCAGCSNYKFCINSNLDRLNIIADNICYAMEKGKLFNEELGGGIKSYCTKTSSLVNEINKITGLFLSYEKSIKSEDESKLLISTELENFAKIFENFANNTKKSPKFNKNISILAKETLLNDMIDVYEIAVLEGEDKVDQVKIIADNELVLKRELVESLRKIFGKNLRLSKLEHLELSGMSQATFIPEPMLDCRFAVSTKAKEQSNGDNICVEKIGDDKFFVAIADGMGHGKSANKISNMVLELVKSMFSVGLDIGLIIESVNKLLIPVGIDNFSTLDICVIDLNMKICSFIKLGSSVSILKHKTTSEIIASKSLPVGIVQNIKPTVIQKRINDGDVIFLASDGVVDAFGDTERYKCFVNDWKLSNTQTFIDSIIEDISVSGVKHQDDMSIIAINLLKKS